MDDARQGMVSACARNHSLSMPIVIVQISGRRGRSPSHRFRDPVSRDAIQTSA
jgi:hypothetical protein